MTEFAMNSHIEDAYYAFNAHDLDGYLDAFVDDGVLYDPLVNDGVTGSDLHDYMATVFDAFPDIAANIKRVIANETETAVELTYTGTHTGSFEGIPPTGNTAILPVVTIITVSSEGITSWRDYWDQRTFAEELGLTFPAILGQLPTLVWGKLQHR